MSTDLILHRVSILDPTYLELVTQLDRFLAEFNGPDEELYSGFNSAPIFGGVVALWQGVPAGCGALKVINDELGEVKRMFVKPEYRGKGIARKVLSEIEQWAVELGLKCVQLETGVELPEARGLYERSGYIYIPNYEPYVGLERSICMAKNLTLK